MDFLVSKLVEHLLLPSNLIGFVGVLGLASLLIGWRGIGRSLLTISLVALLLAGWSPLGSSTLKLLEDRFPTPRIEGPVSGIIMLGGAINTHITKDRGAAALNDAGERITAVAVLARKHPDARILLSGGASDLTAAEPVTESAIAKDQLRALGVAANRIELEEGSRNTCENAEQSAVVGKPKNGQTWLLVTSASHMPRAVACFRAVGFSVVPFPVDYRTLDARWPAVSIATGLQMLDLAAHEWIGLVGYRVLARTEELFPTP